MTVITRTPEKEHAEARLRGSYVDDFSERAAATAAGIATPEYSWKAHESPRARARLSRRGASVEKCAGKENMRSRRFADDYIRECKRSPGKPDGAGERKNGTSAHFRLYRDPLLWHIVSDQVRPRLEYRRRQVEIPYSASSQTLIANVSVRGMRKTRADKINRAAW